MRGAFQWALLSALTELLAGGAEGLFKQSPGVSPAERYESPETSVAGAHRTKYQRQESLMEREPRSAESLLRVRQGSDEHVQTRKTPTFGDNPLKGPKATVWEPWEKTHQGYLLSDSCTPGVLYTVNMYILPSQ